MSRLVVVCALALAGLAPARAEEVAAGVVTVAAETAEAPPALAEEIEVKGRLRPRVDSLEVREVRETPARDLGEALEQQLGLGKVRKGGIANDLVLRGLKKDDVTVTVDGARVHGACPSRMDPPSFHLDYAEVDRVEVKRGPFDVTQPGGLGGVVEVKTRAAHAGFGSEVNLGYGAFEAVDASAVGSYGGERADVLGGLALKRSGPYVSGDGRNFTEVIPRFTGTAGTARNGPGYRDTSDHRTAYDVRSGWLKAGFLPAEGQRLEVAWTRQSAVDVLYPYLLMDGTVDDTDRVTASWRLSGEGALSHALVSAWYSRVEHDMDDRERCSSSSAVASCAGALPRAYSMRTLAKSQALGGKLEVGFGDAAGSADLDISLGADVYVRGWDNTTTRVNRAAAGTPYLDEASIPDVTITDVGLFAQVKRDLGEALRATAGARVDLAGSKAAVDRTALYRTFFATGDLPRSQSDVLFAGNVQLDWTVGGGAALFAGYGHGARLPDPQERYMALSGMGGKPAWVGFPALRPTTNDELDVGAKWAVGGAVLKAQAYQSWVTDYVTLADASGAPPVGGGAAPTAKTYRNVAATLRGGELSARTALPWRLYAGAAVAYTRGQNESAGTPLAEIPPLRANLSLRWDSGRFFAEVEEQWAARQDRVDPGLNESPTAAWFVTNLKLGAEWHGVKGFAGVRNLLDKRYVEHLGYLRDPFGAGVKVPEPGRLFYTNLQYDF